MINYIGTAGWNIPEDYRKYFSEEGTHLKRYSSVFNAVEINSSFYKEHLPRTYKKWAQETPDNFRFSIKLNKQFSHSLNLSIDSQKLKDTLSSLLYLEEKLHVILIQFPGSQNFKKNEMDKFYKIIRKVFQGNIAIEPRNLTWIESDSIELMKEYHISKVIADPDRCPGYDNFNSIDYYRLHGSPNIYRSSYSETYLDLITNINKAKTNVWCIFDNTMSELYMKNALTLLDYNK